VTHSIARIALAQSAFAALGTLILAAPARAGTPTSCESLTAFSFPDTTINSATSMPGGPYVAPDVWHLAFTNLPPSCQVSATIKPTSDSNINVQVWMPTQRYNGRYLGTGNGGYAGGFFQSELAAGINNGFATANTDMGTSPADGISADALVGHPEKWKDFGWRATHVMTTFSKALIAAFYGNAPGRSYFAGCSTGGQQALMEAQRFPDDYDGILAGAPAHNRTHLHTVTVAQYRATHTLTTPSVPSTGYIPVTKFDAINQAVLAQCRGQDGGVQSDPFLSDPRDCKFDPAKLQCPGNVDKTSTSLRSTACSNGCLALPGSGRRSTSTRTSRRSIRCSGPTSTPPAPDLRPFANRGGKLILYAGWADPLIPSGSTINYFNALAQTMFGSQSPGAIKQTQTFARVFMAPGTWHCQAGPGPNSVRQRHAASGHPDAAAVVRLSADPGIQGFGRPEPGIELPLRDR
jgi:Tannase and feruloyl esterase